MTTSLNTACLLERRNSPHGQRDKYHSTDFGRVSRFAEVDLSVRGKYNVLQIPVAFHGNCNRN